MTWMVFSVQNAVVTGLWFDFDSLADTRRSQRSGGIDVSRQNA
jgi:hypothetical protein